MKDPLSSYPGNWAAQAQEHRKVYRKMLERTDRNKMLRELPALHEEAFSRIQCLDCANCCKNYSPRFKQPDIRRIAKKLKMKEGAFVDTYLRLDEDGDYVVKKSPCPFLSPENYCTIYEDRPSDCARYPYTNEDVLIKRTSLTLKNATVCPAVFYVMEKLLGLSEKR